MKIVYEPKLLYKLFTKLKISEKLSYSMGEKVIIDPTKIECLKSTKRSSIYKLLLRKKSGYYPIIFKVYSSTTQKNEVEINIYKKLHPLLKEFLPQIYLIERNPNEDWVFMEFVNQIRGQLKFTPKHLDYIIPTVAKLHARTFEDKFKKYNDAWSSWLPTYDSASARKEREKYIEKTVVFLDEAVSDDRTKDLIKPYYKSLIKLYSKGPDFFPEILESGSSLTHGDLHMQNICSKDVTKDDPWNIQFIDWESARYAPTWFDMVVLVEILLGFRADWQKYAEEIRNHCIVTYVNEMKKHGIKFKTDPRDLYKMAYLQRTLEKGLHTQLRRIFDNRGGELLGYHLEKVAIWGRELGID